VSQVAVIPLDTFIKAEGDSHVAAELAKSAERAAVLKFLHTHAGNPALPGNGRVIRLLAKWIEEGKHV
jgi:hypothetical protein